MSEEMAIGDNVTSEEAKLNGDEASAASAVDGDAVAPVAPEPQAEPEAAPVEDAPTLSEEVPKVEEETSENVNMVEAEQPSDKLVAGDGVDEGDEKRGVKRRASAAFSDAGKEDFKGFETVESVFESSYSEVYSRIVDRLEAEVTAAVKEHTPLRSVMATPPVPLRASKRPRQDTDGSRPSSALSSRSDGDGVISTDATSTASSPAHRGGRRATTEMSSPLLRVPLERGWKRELVYRAALDAHSRRNADIYYYTPRGKKLRSTREVSEHLSGTGLTLENFSFFKEPLGLDDPEKEIIRDAKMIRRVESPVAAPPAAEGKRTPKPKPPKGASPEPKPATVKSPPAKIRVKSVGSRLSTSSPAPPAPNANAKQQKKPADNNNSAAWKKPRPLAAPPAAPLAVPLAVPPAAPPVVPPVAPPPPVTPPQPPPPLQSRPPPSPDVTSPRQLVQPCSMTCGLGLPTVACAACLCLYHPACIGNNHTATGRVLCKNCRSSPPPLEPPPLTHKSGVSVSSLPAPVPRRLPGPLPVPVPVPVPKGVRPDKRVTLRMKVAGGGPDGERMWAVAPQQPPRALLLRAQLPQSVAVLSGRRFIVVPREIRAPK